MWTRLLGIYYSVCCMYTLYSLNIVCMYSMQIFCMHGMIGWPTTLDVKCAKCAVCNRAWDTVYHNVMRLTWPSIYSVMDEPVISAVSLSWLIIWPDCQMWRHFFIGCNNWIPFIELHMQCNEVMWQQCCILVFGIFSVE